MFSNNIFLYAMSPQLFKDLSPVRPSLPPADLLKRESERRAKLKKQRLSQLYARLRAAEPSESSDQFYAKYRGWQVLNHNILWLIDYLQFSGRDSSPAKCLEKSPNLQRTENVRCSMAGNDADDRTRKQCRAQNTGLMMQRRCSVQRRGPQTRRKSA